ncbi:Protein gpr107 [Clonorchis sinensis]|uniref:Protein gpr107 n=2 Tax=Clonorchis sinensis TaxID=79923 RepID=A0A8T1MI65_CLOSI|nr:Protein gpr107 [Clonorchis sinensis]
MLRFLFAAFVLLSSIFDVYGRRHVLKLKNDLRGAVLCSRFGFMKGGYFSVSLEQLDGNLMDISFTLDRSENSGMAGYLAAKPDNCFRGDPQKFLYMSFDKKNEQIVIHNQDLQLQGLVFEAISKNMDEETGQNTIIPATLTDAIQLMLESLNLVPDRSAESATHISELLKSTQLILPNSYEQSSVYLLLRRLAEIKLSGGLSTDEAARVKRQTNQTSDEQKHPGEKPTIRYELPESIVEILRAVYRMTTPLGSLRVIPYRTLKGVIKARFTVRFPNVTEEGLYSFYVHNCPSVEEGSTKRQAMNLTLNMVEKNTDSYLSAGQRSLPLLYFVMFCVYLSASFIWFIYLRMSKNSKFRIHYLMFAVVLVKAVSLAFHGVNYYVIGKHGVHEEGWAVMYYITHIIRGALLFITILLIGAGWTFIKHMLTPRERNVFLIVIPLQILANVATVVIEESEAGTARYMMWRDIFIFVDLACCGAILFPVVWSIRHLQTASQTDGKAAINLRNLRLFRHFYILVICYVYFTRVVAYLLTITVPFSYCWTVELFTESITFLFFVAVGYKFRPISDNPYLLVPNEDEDEEEDTVMERIQLEEMWSQSGVTDGVTRLARPQPNRKSKVTVDGQLNQGFIDQDVLPDETGSLRPVRGV